MQERTYEYWIGMLDGILARRAAAHPHRDASQEEFVAASGEFTAWLLGGLDQETFKPEPGAFKGMEELAESPVFVCGQMKSGTGLLTTLLDDHPQLCVTPVGTHYLRTEAKFRREQFPEIARHWIEHVINPTGKEPFWFLGRERKTFESMLQHLHFFLGHTNHDAFVCAALALHACRPRVETARYWVEKSTQNELHAEELRRRFPRAKFLHIVRDPLTNLASLKRMTELRSGAFRARKRAQDLRKLMQAGSAHEKAMGPDTYRIVRYEDLVHDPKGTMTGVADFLGIRFTESLLTPTESGRPATSNSMYRESRVRGQVLDQSRNDRYLQDLTRTERREIVGELRETAEAFGYAWPAEATPWRNLWPFGRRG